MTREHPDPSVPPAFLASAGALIVLTIVAAAYVRWTGDGTVKVQPSPAVVTASLQFEDEPGGGVLIRSTPTADPSGGVAIHRIAPGEDNFIRGTMRTFARDRKRQNVGTTAPFLLSYRADGRLSLEDPSTGRKVDLEAFGPPNSSAFAKLLGPARRGELRTLADGGSSPRAAAPH